MRSSIRKCLVGVALLSLSIPALGQAYPAKPVRFVIGFPPGTVVDAVARLAGNVMEKRLGQPILLEFKPGASATIAAKYVTSAEADGYTLYYGSAVTFHPILNRNNAVDAAKELLPVAGFATAPWFLFANPKIQFNSFKELVAYSKANPGVLRHSTASATSDLVSTLLMARTGLVSQAIPYKGPPPAIIALLAGEIELGASTLQPYLPSVQASKIRALFVAASARSPLLPNVPTSVEAGVPDFELSQNYGLWAPMGTPKEIIQKLGGEAIAAVKSPAISEQIRKGFAAEPSGLTAEELLRTFEGEVRFWAEAARAANFKPE